jgi:hypothetical protein
MARCQARLGRHFQALDWYRRFTTKSLSSGGVVPIDVVYQMAQLCCELNLAKLTGTYLRICNRLDPSHMSTIIGLCKWTFRHGPVRSFYKVASMLGQGDELEANISRLRCFLQSSGKPLSKQALLNPKLVDEAIANLHKRILDKESARYQKELIMLKLLEMSVKRCKMFSRTTDI